MEKNLGHATAYGYAKSKGYSGTEEEFAQLMADYASVGQSAAQSAEQAAASATSASGSAATATQAAQTATSKASEAVTAADTATTKASEASTSADTASTAAQTATDKASEATTAATTATTKASEASESAATATTAKTDAESARDAAVQSASRAEQSAESIDPDEFNRKIYAAFATDAATGAIASFADGADNIPMKNVVVHIEPVQAGSGDPSPDNVRPITGWTGAKVTRTGKNLFDGNFIAAYLSGASPATYFIGTAQMLAKIPIKGGETYRVTKTGGNRLAIAEASQEPVEGEHYPLIYSENVGDKSVSVQTKSDSRLLLVYVSNETASVQLQVEPSATATDYEPYSGQTYDIAFPTEAGTVYGGTLDVTNGELVVDKKTVVFPNNYKFNLYTNQNKRRFEFSTLDYGFLKDERASISSHFKLGKSNNAPFGYFYLTNATSAIYFTFYDGDSKFASVSELETWLQEQATNGTPVQVTFELATPQTYTLTPQEITSLLGVNNLWADTGGSEVEYRADAKSYITKKITEAVSALS